ncbi:MAG: hypothetical protein RSB42_07655, partial [Comamonas sp.]
MVIEVKSRPCQPIQIAPCRQNQRPRRHLRSLHSRTPTGLRQRRRAPFIPTAPHRRAALAKILVFFGSRRQALHQRRAHPSALLQPASPPATTHPYMSYASETRRRRTFAIISHPDAGKTTLTEK